MIELEEIEIVSIHFQRNGVTGESFHTVYFQHEGCSRIGIVFGDEKNVAVIEPGRRDEAFRGDMYESALRKAIGARFHEWNLDTLIGRIQETGATVDMDNDGQIIIYTNFMENDNGELVQFEIGD